MNNKIIIKKFEVFSKKYYKQLYKDPKIWENHILLTRSFALKLARIEKADTLVVEIAALLHDIGKYKSEKNHVIVSYELSKNFLKQFDIPKEKVKLILKCIAKHSSQFSKEKNEVEVKIIQSADILGTLFNNEWQEHQRKTIPENVLLDSYEKAENKINLKSAKKIAKPQIQKLKRLL